MEVLSQHGISQETAAMIVRKQSVEKEMKQRNDDMQEQQQHKQYIEQHIQIANGMRSLFIQKEKKGMW
jgi:ribosomal protein S13